MEKGENNPDIPNMKDVVSERDKRKISKLLDAKRVESTDWGGWFFYDTVFGNVDVFFDISKFDY